VGGWLRRTLDRLSPGWEEGIDWGYVPENPSLWPILVALPLLLLASFTRLMVGRQDRNQIVASGQWSVASHQQPATLN
jgi:hypothetical protein